MGFYEVQIFTNVELVALADALYIHDPAGPVEQVRQTRQLPDQSYRNPQFKDFHCLLDTLIVLAN